jgi:hypothetical protein
MNPVVDTFSNPLSGEKVFSVHIVKAIDPISSTVPRNPGWASRMRELQTTIYGYHKGSNAQYQAALEMDFGNLLYGELEQGNIFGVFGKVDRYLPKECMESGLCRFGK